MTIKVNGEDKRIGLSLSGGGFRAAGFHLGVFRKLQELKILWNIDLLTCVSGGSIAGCFIATRWGDDKVLDDLEEYLKTRSIDVSSAIGGLFHPFKSRLDVLADTYDEHLFHGKTLGDLQDGPRVYLNSTNLASGNMFFFVAGGNKPPELGEHELGQFDGKSFLLSKAVAASSAFPPVFPPLKIESNDYPFKGVDYVALTDGGVYDNLGVNPLLRVERNQIDYSITSDGGKPYYIDESPTDKGSIVLLESINIMMEQIRGLQFQRLKWQFKANQGPKPIWFSIDSIEGEARAGDAQIASNIPTRLQKLSNSEIEVLSRQGAALVESRLREYSPELLGD